MNVTEIRRPADMERITTPELAKAFIDEQVALIKEQVGDKKVLLALSGGVDSSVVAALLIKAIGQQLVCVHVNHGLLRKGEPEEVIEVFRNQMNANLVYVDATDRFLEKLAGVEDPETKRKIIGGEFIEVFAEEARKLEGIEFLAQGTIWPDILESEDGIKETDMGVMRCDNARACYPEAKRLCETMLAAYEMQYGIQYVGVRLCHTFGPGIVLNDGRAFSEFIRNVLEGKDIVLQTDGSAERTYTYVADAIGAMLLAFTKGKENYYNIANLDNLISIRDLAKLIVNLDPKGKSKVVFADGVEQK